MFFIVFDFSIYDFLFISFRQKKEIEKGKYSNGVQIFTFLLEYRFVWRQRCIDFKKEIWQIVISSENVFKGNLMFQFSWTEEFHHGKVSGRWTLDELQYENGLNGRL